MANTGSTYPTVGANGLGGLINWTNTSNITSNDDSGSTCTLGSANGSDNQSKYLNATAYGFSLPSDATINGIIAKIKKRYTNLTGSPTCADFNVYLTKDGSFWTGDNKATATAFTTSYVEETYGGSSDLWGDTWTKAQIESSNFGLIYQCRVSPASSLQCTAEIDYIILDVYYTSSSGSGIATRKALLGVGI